MQLTVSLPKFSSQPLYKQISDALRSAILEKRVKAGDKLPSTRELSESLMISRLTVGRGLEDLASQGFVQSIPGSGTYVSDNWQSIEAAQATKMVDQTMNFEPYTYEYSAFSSYAKRVVCLLESESISSQTQSSADFTLGTDNLPTRRWCEMLHKATRLAGKDGSLLKQGDSFGDLSLREALASFLGRSRSILCTADQIAIFSSPESASNSILRLLVDAGDTIGVEDPGSQKFRTAALLHGANLFPIPVDESGIIVKTIEDSAQEIKALYVTPSHQDPTGSTLSRERRQELLEWCAGNDTIIIEDDCDFEYRYGERPFQALAGMDQNDLVIYKSSFYKSLYPLIKFGFVVYPRHLVDLARHSKSYEENEMPLIEQKALTYFLEEGHLELHLKRTQQVLAKKRAAAIYGIRLNFENATAIASQSAGLHLLLNFPDYFKEETIMQAAQEADVHLVSTRDHYLFSNRRGEYMLHFAATISDKLVLNISRFAEILKVSELENFSCAPGEAVDTCVPLTLVDSSPAPANEQVQIASQPQVTECMMQSSANAEYSKSL